MAAVMWKILDSRLNVLVHQGHLYVPLLFDPDIDKEAHVLISQGWTSAGCARVPGPGSPPAVMAVGDALFVPAVRVSSLVDNYARLFPHEYAEGRQVLRERHSLTADLFGVALDPTLVTIIFHILPHFLRREGLHRRRPLTEEEVLDLIRQRAPAPHHFCQQARKFLDVQPLKEALKRLASAAIEPPPPPEGLMPAASLRAWWDQSLAARLLAAERARLLKELEDREQWAAAQEGRLAVLLHVAEKGFLELDGFGFNRLKGGQGYRVYKRTGPYALEDFYGRVYLFPDCRVAVRTFGWLRPFVVDQYKHPFLRRHGSSQPICVGSESQNLAFSARNAIQVIEEGIHTLLYSYDRRRRRGYHRLDPLPGMMRLVDFEDYRVPPDHPLIASGQLKVTNRET
jgi:hypothetical protein